jgi:hypothetical protein
MSRRDWDKANRRDRAKADREPRRPWKPPATPVNPANPPAVYRTLLLRWPSRCLLCHERILGGERAREVKRGDARRGFLHEHHGI